MMQWLIDIVYEAVMAAIGPHNPFVNRGNTTAHDFAVGDFQTDGAYHELDLSPIVPSGAKAVLCKIQIRDGLINQHIQFRPYNFTSYPSNNTIRTQIANIYSDGTFTIAHHTDGVIMYQAANTIFSNIYLTVLGWWL